MPFVGSEKGGTENTHFGYIFGASSHSDNNSYVPNSLTKVTITSATTIGGDAFNGCANLTSVVIPDSVTSIGSSAFSGCSGLTTVTIGNGVTTIGGYAFYGCSALTSVAIPNSVTSVGSSAFSGCSGLTSITIGNGVTSIGESAFNGCSNVADITIPDGVTTIDKYAFYNWNSLTSVTIPDSVTSIGEGAFYGCSSLKSITIPDSVTTIGYSAFYGCDSLQKITLPFIGDSKDGTNNTHFGYIFGASSYSNNNSCVPKSLTDVVITSATSIGTNAFFNCNSLTSVTIPNSVRSIGGNAFQYCYKLVEVYNLTSISINIGATNSGYVGYYAKVMHRSKDEESILKSVNDFVFMTIGGTNYLVAYHGSDTDMTLPSNYNGENYAIYQYAFYNCSSLTSVTIPDSVTSIGGSAFSGCDKLVEVYNLSSLSITNGSYYDNGSVGYCAKVIHTSKDEESLLKNVNGFIFITVDDVNYLVAYKGSDTDIALPTDYNGEGYEINRGAFKDCSKLTSVIIPDSITSISDNMFWNCSSLTTVTIPDSVTSIGSYAFNNCSDIENIYITDLASWCNVSNLSYLMDYGKTSKSFYLNDELVTDLVIPEGVTSVPNYAFKYCGSIKSVTIADSVTSIGYQAFYNCGSLTSVTIGNSVTSIGTAFGNCEKLVEVYNLSDLTITKGSGSNGDVGYYAQVIHTSKDEESILNNVNDFAFMALDGVNYLVGYNGTNTDITLPTDYNGENYEIYKYAFKGCSKLTSVTIPDSVTSIGQYAFVNCSSLTSVTIGNGVATIGYAAFRYCSGLTSVTIGGSVISIDSYAFEGCNGIENIYITDLMSWCNISRLDYLMCYSKASKNLYLNNELITDLVIPDSVTNIGQYAFYGCGSLTSVTIPDSVTTIGYSAFYGCSGLTSVTIGDSVTDINERAFYGCSSITSIIFPDSVTSIGPSAFRYCSSLTSATIGNGVRSIYADAFQSCSSLENIYISDLASWCNISGLSNLMQNGKPTKNLYLNNELVKDLVIPDTVTSIGQYAFYDCDSITSVTIPDGVTSIGDYAFRNCTGIMRVTIPNSVTSIGSGAFDYCYKLVEVYNLSDLTIEKGAFSNGYIGYYAKAIHTSEDEESILKNVSDFVFMTVDGVNYLVDYNGTDTDITLPTDYNGESYEIYKYAFYNCSSLTSVTISNSVTSIGQYAFFNCSGLMTVTIGNGVTGIGDYAFNGCDSLTSVTIPDNVISIGSNAFYGCDALTSVTICDGVTNIGSGAFSYCDSLTSVTIPDSVTSIGSSAFAQSGSLTTINYTGSEEEWNNITKGKYWDYKVENYTINYNYVEEQ